MTNQEVHSNAIRPKSIFDIIIVVLGGIVLSTAVFLAITFFTKLPYQKANGISWIIGFIGSYFIYKKKVSQETEIKPNKSPFNYWLGLLVLLWGIDMSVMFGSVILIEANPYISKILSLLVMSMVGYGLLNIFGNKSVSKQKGVVPICYTILFIAIAIISLFAFFFGHYALVYDGDGFSQHYTLFKNFREELLSLIRTAKLPAMWDWSYGIGASWFSKYVYYNLGDVFSYLSLLSPTKYLAQWFSFIVLLRAYFAGLAYYSYAKRRLKSQTALIVTSLAYAFSPLVIMNITRHPFFINVMIIFPLLLLGIDKVMSDKKIGLFIGMTVWAIINNFYFAWLLAIGGFVYLILNYIMVYRFKESFFSFLKPFLVGLVAIIGLVGVYIIPVLINVKMMSRGEDIFANDLLTYNLRYYLRLPLDLINMNGGRDYNFFGGYSVVFVLALAYLIRRRKTYGVLLMSLFLGGLILISPTLASIVSGLGSPIHRWMLLLNLPVALSIGYLIENFKSINAKDILSSIYIYSAAIAFTIIGENFKTTSSNLTIPLLFIGLSLILVLCSYSHMLNYGTARHLLAIIVVLNVFVNVWSYHSVKSLARIDKSTNTVDYLEASIKDSFAGADRVVETSPSERLQLSSANRIMPAKLFRGNTSSLLNVYQLNSYNSIQNKYVNDMLVNDFGNENFPAAPFVVAKDDPTLLRFMGVKYYVSKDKSYVPSGYKNMKSARLENNVVISEAPSVVPFAYSSSTVISEERMNNISQPEKLGILLDTVVTSESSELETYKNKIDIEKVPYEIKDDTTNEIVKAAKNKKYHFLAGHSYSVRFKTGLIKNKEDVYVSLSSAIPKFVELEERFKRSMYQESTLALSKGELPKEITPYDRLKFYNTHAFSFDDKKINFKVTGKTLSQLVASDGTTSGNGYRKILNQSYYLGKGNNKIIHLKNNSANDLVVSNLEFIIDPTTPSKREEKIKVLNKNRMKTLRFEKNRVSGTIENDSDTILATKIPYQPGWSVNVNGKESKIERVNYAFAGVKLNPGKNKVEFKYKEPGLLLGGCITVMTLFFIIIILGYKRFKYKKI